MNDDEPLKYKRFRELFENFNDSVSAFCRKTNTVDMSGVPATQEQKNLWDQLSEPEFEEFIAIAAMTPGMNAYSLVIWNRILAECRAKSKSLALAH